MMADISVVGSNVSFGEQRANVLNDLNKGGLIEDSFKKSASYDSLVEDNKKKEGSSVTALFNGGEIEQKSELNQREILIMSRLLFASGRYKLSGIDKFVNNLLKLKVSHRRQGRREFIDGLHAEEKHGQPREPR